MIKGCSKTDNKGYCAIRLILRVARDVMEDFIWNAVNWKLDQQKTDAQVKLQENIADLKMKNEK